MPSPFSSQPEEKPSSPAPASSAPLRPLASRSLEEIARGAASKQELPSASPETAEDASNSGEPKLREIFAQRRRARVWALQASYAASMSSDSLAECEMALREMTFPPEEDEEFGDLEPPDPEGIRFALALGGAARAGAQRYDDLLSQSLKNWRIERLTLIDRLILRLALAELESNPETPWRVVLNEYIEVAKVFGTDQSARFVNGVLDAAARSMRPGEAAPKRRNASEGAAKASSKGAKPKPSAFKKQKPPRPEPGPEKSED